MGKGQISHSNVSLFSVSLLSVFILLSFTIVFSDQKVFAGGPCDSVSFDMDSYSVSDTATITVTGSCDATEGGYVPLTVCSDTILNSDYECLNVNADETGEATGIFVAEIEFTTDAGCDCSGLLVTNGDEITVTTPSAASDTAMIESLGAAPTVTEIGSLDHISKGLAFVPGDGDTLYSIPKAGSFLRTIDQTNGDTLDQITISYDGCGECLDSVDGGNGLAWDAENGKLWAIVRINGDTVRALAIIDPSIDGSESPNISFVGILPYNFAGLAVDPTMELLGITGKGGSNSEKLFSLISLDTMPETFSDPDDAPDITPDLVVALDGGDNGEAIAFNTGDDLLYHTSSGLFESVDLSTTTKHAINIIDTLLDNNEPTALTYWESEDALYETQWFCSEGCTTILYRIDLAETTPIPTTVILNSITDPYTLDKFTVTGKLINDNTELGVSGKLVEFEGDGAVADLLDATTSGFTVNDSPTIVIGHNGTDKILRLNNDATINFPSNPPQVILSLKDMGTNTFTAQVTTLGTPTSFSASGVGKGSNIGSLVLTDSDGISSIKITSLSSGTAGITKVQAFNSQLVSYIDEEFDTAVNGSSTQSFAEGSFFSIGTAQSTPANELTVNATFSGDESYAPSATELCGGEGCIQTNNTQTYSVHYTTGGGFGGSEAFISSNGGGYTNLFDCADDDRDGLCNDWETSGIPVTGEANLMLPGANPNKKNIYVEVDYMTGRNPFVTGANNDGIDDVITAFSNAPVTNPNGASNGIILTVVQGDQITESIPTLNVWTDTDGVLNDFDNVKAKYFGSTGDSVAKKNAKAQAYHYFIFANSIPGGASGVSELPGNDGVVALGVGFDGTRQQVAGTFMHELGHNLNLDHGGPANVNYQDRSINCKPNHDSVMSYSRQLPNLLSYPGEWVLDYSDGGLSPINGNPAASLKESGGAGSNIAEVGGNLYNNDNAIRPGTDPTPWIIWGTPNIAGVEIGVAPAAAGAVPSSTYKKQLARGVADIDWNGDGALQPGSAIKKRDLNGFGFFGCESGTFSTIPFKNYNEWAELLYNFRGVQGGTFDAARPLGNSYNTAVPDIDPVIVDQQQLFSASHNALIPWKADSSITLKKGIPIPIDVRMFDGAGNSLVKADGTVSYKLYKSGSSTVLSSGSLVYDKFVTKSWVGLVKAPSTTGTYFIQLTFTNTGGAIVTKDITPNTNPVYTNTGNQMSLKVTVN